MPKISQQSLNEIKEKINEIFTSQMVVEDYKHEDVPSTQKLTDTNHGLILTNCSILFVDIRSSTELSDKSQAKSMAKIYRAFARAMSMCIYECGGSVRQIAGDRVMGVFLDDKEESSAMKSLSAARAIVTVVHNIFNPLCKANVNQKTIECGVGIDIGRVLTTSVGIEHDGEDTRDLVWAGKTANTASKHTDLAHGGEIFVTKRFYEKLPLIDKVGVLGSKLWHRHLRFKGSYVFEGYGAVNHYITHHDSKQVRDFFDSISLVRDDTPERISDGVNQEDIITDIVEGVRKRTGDLLERFEALVHRERDLLMNEDKYQKLQESLLSKEQALSKREEELNAREKLIKKEVERQKAKAAYEVRTSFFIAHIHSYSLEEALEQLEEIQIIGKQLGKTPAQCNHDLQYFLLVDFFKQKETSVAYQIIIEQMRAELPFYTLPAPDDVIFVVKTLGKEVEYLRIVRSFVKMYEPTYRVKLSLKGILLGLGIDENSIGTIPLL